MSSIRRIYTKSGDKGNTSLACGTRATKACLRCEACGDVDELNAALGVVKAGLGTKTEFLTNVIECFQRSLFELGAELSCNQQEAQKRVERISKQHIEDLEDVCDRFAEGLPELRAFLLPGGSNAAAGFHFARTVTRRAERSLVRLKESGVEGDVRPELVVYLNRLSDALFVLARRVLAEEGAEAPLWNSN